MLRARGLALCAGVRVTAPVPLRLSCAPVRAMSLASSTKKWFTAPKNAKQSREIVASYQANGFVVVRDLVPPHSLAELKQEIASKHTLRTRARWWALGSG
jgi:hypothetical protein